MKILVKEGWTNQDGKKNRTNSICLVQYLQDVLETFAINCVAQY
jgi:hypothetical protein